MDTIKIEDCLNNWTPAQLAEHAARVSNGRPVRYFARPQKLPLLESCWWWIIKRRWFRYTTTFEPVYPNDPRYEQAPFEATAFVAPESR